jgi:hypothetical protein
VPTKLTDFAPFLHKVWQSGGQILREFLSVFIVKVAEPWTLVLGYF